MEKQTRTKKSMKMKGLLIGIGILSITAAAGTAAFIADREAEYQSLAKEFVESKFIEEEKSVYLGDTNDEYLLPKYQECTTITRGKYIAQEMEKREILYCELLDEYYTPDGSPIVIIDTSLSDGKAFMRRTEVLDGTRTIVSNVGDNVRIVNAKPYSDLEDLNLVVVMPTETKVINNNQEMYEGTLTLKKK